MTVLYVINFIKNIDGWHVVIDWKILKKNTFLNLKSFCTPGRQRHIVVICFLKMYDFMRFLPLIYLRIVNFFFYQTKFAKPRSFETLPCDERRMLFTSTRSEVPLTLTQRAVLHYAESKTISYSKTVWKSSCTIIYHGGAPLRKHVVGTVPDPSCPPPTPPLPQTKKRTERYPRSHSNRQFSCWEENNYNATSL